MTADSAGHWDINQRAAFLATTRMFGSLPAAALREVAGALTVLRVPRGRSLFTEGEPAGGLFLLAAGRVKILLTTEDGREVILRVIGPGDIFGGASGWGEPAYPATAAALEDSTALRLPTARFSELIVTSPAVALAVVGELSGRLREAEARIRELQTERVERRIARTLLRLAARTGTRTADGVELGLPLSRQDLADMAGTTLSTASRVLSGWDERGILISGRERVVLRRPHRLVAIADELPLPDEGR